MAATFSPVTISKLYPFFRSSSCPSSSCPSSSLKLQLISRSTPNLTTTVVKVSSAVTQGWITDINQRIEEFCELENLSGAMRLMSIAGSEISVDSYCSVLQLCAELESVEIGRKIHSILSSFGLQVNPVLGSKLVFMYVKCGELNEGRKVFENCSSMDNLYVWYLLISEYAKIGEFGESISLFNRMRVMGVQPNSQTFTCVLKCFSVTESARGGERAHGYLLKLGFNDYVAVANALIAFYSKSKKIQLAIAVFDEMPERDVISWNSIINGCIINGKYGKGVEMFVEMWVSGFDLDTASLVSVLPACAQVRSSSLGRVVHAFSIKSGFSEELVLGNSLLDMYSKCGNLESATRIFGKMNERSVVSWTSMISAFTRSEQFEKAIDLFGLMEAEGIEPDRYTITSILHTCACHGALNEGKYIHAYVVRNRLESNLIISNALMDMYAKCGDMKEARSVFDHMKWKDVISWNTMIGGYSKNGFPNEAFRMFNEMQSSVEPNPVTMACILPAVASLSSLDRGREIHCHILRAGYLLDGYVANAILDMYVKCGALLLARSLFDGMVKKDLITWTIMIAGYGMHGHGRDAITLFKEMRNKGLKPDGVSFVAILYACSHSGLVNEGWTFFNSMRNNYNIEPNLEHYACMVDLLSRAGHLTKAYSFIKAMPIEPDATIWGALLCGCRAYRDVKLAEIVAEHVFELEPENTGYYVLLANIYTEAEKWESVKNLRQRIGGRRLRKEPGCSWIELKSKFHIFVAGDKSHPQAKRIESYLGEVRKRMKDEGYIQQNRYALLNADEKMKDEALCGHSEKLAIGFGILNSSEGKPIRVSKNLRVCGDCHEFAKFTSKITGREIILRDSNRFHHFKDGRCSCRGYW